jgi:orotate phosphoribosyltransferase-like protein
MKSDRAMKEMAIELRRQGLSYNEINTHLYRHVSKSTLSLWCRSVELSKADEHREFIR